VTNKIFFFSLLSFVSAPPTLFVRRLLIIYINDIDKKFRAKT